RRALGAAGGRRDHHRARPLPSRARRGEDRGHRGGHRGRLPQPDRLPGGLETVTRIRDAGVLITGASRGIGEAAATELARRGARLALAARSGDDLERVAARLRADGAEVHVIRADVSKEAEVRAMVRTAEEKLGAVDVLINN